MQNDTQNLKENKQKIEQIEKLQAYIHVL